MKRLSANRLLPGQASLLQASINGSPLWMWAAVCGSLLALFALVTLPLWIRLIPDRYVVAYAPPPIAAIALGSPPEDLPSVGDADAQAAAALIDITAAPPTATLPPTPTPRLEPTIPVRPGAATIRSNEPTPTFTPVPIAPRSAIDGTGDADLSQALHLLSGFDYVRQGWNNCGPATMTVAMSYFGVELSQPQAAAALKPNPEDRNVRPDEMQRYAQELGFGMVVGVNGDQEMLKRLIFAGYPVLIEKGFRPETQYDWAGHYITLVGYTDDAFIAMDTYLGANRAYPFDRLESNWREFNRTYLVIYPPNERDIVLSITGPVDDSVMWQAAFERAQVELAQDDDDAFGWFNLGSSLTALGRYEEAATAFDRALELGLPGRMLWYQFGPYEAYFRTGQYASVLTLADAVLAANPLSEEAHYWRGMVYNAQGDPTRARGQFEQALRLNPNYTAAREALDSVSA